MSRKLIIYLSLLLLAFVGSEVFVQYQLHRQHRNDQILAVTSDLAALRANLEQEITANLLLVQGTANFISVTPDLSHEIFENYAQRVLEETQLLKNLGAAPDYVMEYVYPLEGNEAIVGMNYRELPNQWGLVSKVAKNGKLVVAGPLNLAQGGIGLIGRAPVFIYEDNSKQFWGLVSSVIDVDRLYEVVGIDTMDLDIAIRGVDGLGENGAVFRGSEELFDPREKSVLMPVKFPSGHWLIAGKPSEGWAWWHPMAPWVHIGLSLLAAIMGYYLWRSDRHNAQIDLVRRNLDKSQAIAHLGSWELNHASGRIWWSDEVYRIFGMIPNEVEPTLELFFSLVHPDDVARVEEEYHNSLAVCGRHSVDHRIVRRSDGSVRHVQERGNIQCDSKGNPAISRGTMLDITERALAEEESRAKAEQMRAMSEASHDAVIMIDSDDRIMFWSRAAEKMFGWESSEALGQRMHTLITQKDDREEAHKGLKHFSKTGEGPVIGSVSEFMAVRRDGTLIPVERSVSAFPLGDRYYAVGNIRDISERKQAEHELRAYSDRLSLASQAGQIGVWEWDVDENVLIWDPQMFTLYDVEENQFSGLFEAWRSRVHPDDRQQAEQSLLEAVESGRMWEWEFRVVWQNGEVHYIKAAAIPRRDTFDDKLYLTGVNWDVTESRTTQERLRELATTDSLTGLYNRRYFMELAEREVVRAQRYQYPFSLIMFDIDRFKSVNDTYGHDVGDIVLKAIAGIVQEELREVDILGRVGGEEFAIALSDAGLESAKLVAEKLRAAIEQGKATLKDGGTIDFTASLGVVAFSEEYGTLETMFKGADTALYTAKHNGRNRVECAPTNQK